MFFQSRTSIGLSILLSAHCSFTTSQFTSPCSEEGISKCEELWRTCVMETQEETCGPCQRGYVEFPDDIIANLSESLTTEEQLEKLYSCYEIKQLGVDLFLARFQPLYVATANVSDSERLQALIRSAEYVSEFNLAALNNSEAVELALNEFAADAPEDQTGLLGYEPPEDREDSGSDNVLEVPMDDDARQYPSRVDWRELGAVTPVKNQGRCGCCWAMSVVGALEGAAAISSNFTWLKALSQQQLISCDKAQKGCDGGNPARAFDYADDVGVAEWIDYPFADGKIGETTKECTLKGKPIEVEAGGGYKVNFYGTVGDDTYSIRVERLKYALSLGPVSVSMKSNCAMLMLYRKGVLTNDGDCACSPETDPCHDHAILMVGYNDDAVPPYWIVKNSWGVLWGEKGYFRIAQLNPYATEDSWGLFGILGEGIIPRDVFNSTGKTFDKNERWPTWWKIFIACLVILGMCILALILLYIKEHCLVDAGAK